MWKRKWPFFGDFPKMVYNCLLAAFSVTNIHVLLLCKKMDVGVSLPLFGGLALFTTFWKGGVFFLLPPFVYVLFWFLRMDEMRVRSF